MQPSEILKKMPFSPPYFFVDELYEVNEEGAWGSFTYHENSAFYKGHLKNRPIIPESILIETMLQIGGATLAIYLTQDIKDKDGEITQLVSNSDEAYFHQPVYFNEKITVASKKIYYRFKKLKYSAFMKNEKGELVAEGIFSSMQKTFQI